jgi:hypothetical protein
LGAEGEEAIKDERERERERERSELNIKGGGEQQVVCTGRDLESSAMHHPVSI